MLETSAQERLILEVLDPGETIEIRAAAADALLAVTDRRLALAFEVRLALAIPTSRSCGREVFFRLLV